MKNTGKKRKNRKIRLNTNLKLRTSKDTNNRVKGQPTEWGTTFANHLSDKGLISRIYKKLL